MFRYSPAPVRLIVALTMVLGTATHTDASEVPRIQDLQLDGDALAKVLKGQATILYGNPRAVTLQTADGLQRRRVRFVSGMILVDAPPAQVAAVVTDFSAWPQFMPQTNEVEVLKQVDGRTDVAFELEFLLPVVNVDVEYTLAYSRTAAGDLIWHVAEGDVDVNSGRWEFIPIDGGKRTLLVHTVWSDLESMGFVIRQVLGAQPDLKLAIPVSSVAVILDAVRRYVESGGKTGAEPQLEAPDNPARHPEIPLVTRGSLPSHAVAELTRQGTLLFVHPRRWIRGPNGPIDLIFITAAAGIDAPVNRAKHFATQFHRYPEFFPQVQSVDVHPLSDGYRIDWTIQLGFGLLATEVDYTLRYLWASEFALPYRRVKGDLQWIYGAWEWMGLPDGGSVAFYTTASELGEHAPAIVKLGNLIPNRKMVVGASAAGIIIEKQRDWIEKNHAQSIATKSTAATKPAQ